MSGQKGCFLMQEWPFILQLNVLEKMGFINYYRNFIWKSLF